MAWRTTIRVLTLFVLGVYIIGYAWYAEFAGPIENTALAVLFWLSGPVAALLLASLPLPPIDRGDERE